MELDPLPANMAATRRLNLRPVAARRKAAIPRRGLSLPQRLDARQSLRPAQPAPCRTCTRTARGNCLYRGLVRADTSPYKGQTVTDGGGDGRSLLRLDRTFRPPNAGQDCCGR